MLELFKRYKYNLFSALTVIFSSINLVLLYIIFGNNSDLAIFFIVTAVVTSIQLLINLPFEQFLHFFNRSFDKKSSEAKNFYTIILFLSVCFSMILGLILISFSESILNVFTPNFDDLIFHDVFKMFGISSINLLICLPLFIAQQKVNSQFLISVSYLMTFIPIMLQNLTLVIGIFIFEINIFDVALAIVIGNLISFIVGLIFTYKDIKFYGVDKFLINDIKFMMLESIKIKLAHNIHNFSFLFIMNNIASSLPTNFSSLMYGVKRLSDSILTVFLGPLLRTLPNIFSSYIKLKNMDKFRRKLKKISIQNGAIFILATIFAVSISFSLSLFLDLDTKEISFIRTCIIGFFIFSLLVSIELPYSVACMAFGKSKQFYIANIGFAILLSLSLGISNLESFYIFLLFLCFGQLYVFFINIYNTIYYISSYETDQYNQNL